MLVVLGDRLVFDDGDAFCVLGGVDEAAVLSAPAARRKRAAFVAMRDAKLHKFSSVVSEKCKMQEVAHPSAPALNASIM